MASSRTTRAELAATAAVLAFGAFSQQRLGKRTQVPANLAAALTLVVLARRSGLRWSDLGLDPADVPDGLRVGAIAAAPIVGVVVVGVGVPVTRQLFLDERVVAATRRDALFDVLVRIPVATAIAEELIFRSVGFGILSRRHARAAAVAASSLAFGLWHVTPSLHAHRSSPAQERLAGTVGGAAASVAGTVAATALAGALFAGLRIRSRSVVAPIVAHGALNTVAFLGARWAGRSGPVRVESAAVPRRRAARRHRR